jgi:acyl-CoA synthetase (NDP forming)
MMHPVGTSEPDPTDAAGGCGMTRREGTMQVSYEDLSKALAAAGVPIARGRLAAGAEDAVAAAAELGEQVAIKLMSPDLIHKSDVGAVLLAVRGADAVRAAAGQLAVLAGSLALSDGWQFLVQEMVQSTTTEIFIGLKRDPVFGPVIVIGPGGTLVDLLPGRAIARCPVSVSEARDLLRATPLGKILGGYRGGRNAFGAVAALVSAASTIPQFLPDMDQADLNPVVITDQGPVVVDARAAASCVPSSPAASAGAGEPPPDLRPLLEPDSILVIGASATGALMPGNRVLSYLRKHGYPGQVAVVHPTAREIGGYPAVARIGDIPAGTIDLACVAVSAPTCPDIIDQCGSIGVAAAVVLSSGFSEIGRLGLEQDLAATAARHRMALCGPNTVGIMSPGKNVHVCFSQSQDMAVTPGGSVALVAQSGALGGSLASQAWQRGVGIGRFISVGNQASLSTADYIEYLAADPLTETIAVLLEGVSDGSKLLEAVGRAVQAGKAVLIFKVGRTDVGSRAVQSHTGSIAGDYVVYRALLENSGAVLVDSITELLDALVLRNASRTLPSGARVGIVSTSGGACSIAADLCRLHGFEVPQLSDELQANLGKVLPGFAATANPVDVTGHVATEPAIYGRALELILASDEIDAVAVILTTIADPQAGEIAAEVARQAGASPKPVIVAWTIASELASGGLRMLADSGFPVFDDPARAVRAVSLASGRSAS